MRALKHYSKGIRIESFRFEDESDYEYKILLKVFSSILKK